MRFSRKLVLFPLALFLVAASSRAEQVPSPEAFLGFPVGADRKLADWQQITAYFDVLGRDSDRVLVQRLGPTTDNNPFILAIIASPETLAHLDRYREIQEKLADPRQLQGSPEALIQEGKTVVLITCSIHSTEVAAAQMSMEFAYRMATAGDADTKEILDNVIFLLVPSLNPDGINKVNHWYWKTLGTPAEGTSPPELYHSYVGHDNNRDWFMFTQKETRMTVGKIHNVWHPQIVYDVHQMGSFGPRIFVPPFVDPVDPNVDTILQGEIVDLGGYMFSSLIGAGVKGVVTNAIYDAFTPARAYQHYHAGVRILSEAASARLASPIEIPFDRLNSGRNYDARKASWNFPVPWRGGDWHLRDIVDEEEVALKASLLHAALNRETWLRNFFRIGERALHRFPPYAFVIPPQQRDPQSLADLLQVLDFAQVEIRRAQTAFHVASSQLVSSPVGRPQRQDFPAGTYVILMSQPYSSFAKTMLEVQHYPEVREYKGGPLKRPYDVTAQTLGIQLGVETYQVDQPFQVDLRPLRNVSTPSGASRGEGDFWIFSHSNNAFARLANRLLKEGVRLYWSLDSFQAGGESFPPGTMLAQSNRDDLLKSSLQGLPVQVTKTGRRPAVSWQGIRSPHIGLYKSYSASIDEGWTRWILEGYEFPYTTLRDEQVRKGELDFDVIVIPDESLKRLREGLSAPYPDQFRGGLGAEGLAHLKEFVESGKTLVLLGQATQLAMDAWNVPVRDVTRGLQPSDFYVPGSLLRVHVNNRHPIGFGMPPEAAVMFVRSPAFDLKNGGSIATYDEKDVLLSGWISGARHLFGATALADLPMGRGHVILIGFRTQFRAQARGTYKFLFNSLYYATASGEGDSGRPRE